MAVQENTYIKVYISIYIYLHICLVVHCAFCAPPQVSPASHHHHHHNGGRGWLISLCFLFDSVVILRLDTANTAPQREISWLGRLSKARSIYGVRFYGEMTLSRIFVKDVGMTSKQAVSSRMLRGRMIDWTETI